MHYCVFLITKELPSESEIAEIMKPYDESNAEYDEETEERIGDYPVFEWDWYQIGGRYNGSLKLKADLEDEYYRWQYYERTPRNGRLFWSYLLKDMEKYAEKPFYSEEKYFSSMGIEDGFLYVDGARVDDLLNFDEVGCYICIDVDGNAIARESWNGSTFVTDEKFDEKLAEIKKNSKGCFVTVLDIHD